MADIEFKNSVVKVAKKSTKVIKKSAMTKKKQEIKEPEKKRKKKKDQNSKEPEKKRKKKKDQNSKEPENTDQITLDLDTLDLSELNAEALKSMIRQRTATAEKIERANKKEDGFLVDRQESIDFWNGVCNGIVEVLDMVPDEVGPQLYKKTQKQIRTLLVKAMDKAKQGIVQKLEDLDAKR